MELDKLQVRTLLIVDDESEMRACLATEVELLGYNPICAESAAIGIEHIKAGGIHAVLCDIQMPEMSGIEMLTNVRSEGYNLPFVFLTGAQTKENLKSAVRLGAYDFVEKPFRPDDLQSAITRALEIGVRMQSAQEKMNALKSALPDNHQVDELTRDQQHIARLQAISTKKRAD